MSKTVNSTTTSHIWDGTNIAADVTGGTVTKYIRGVQLISAKTGSTESFYNYNGHGDVVQLTNSSGTVTKQYGYDAFGNEMNKVDSDANPFRYCGEYYDKENDSIYLRARYYKPNTGRFITEDPVKDDLNWYVYCSNEPVMLVDPSGLEYIVVSGGKYNKSRKEEEYNYEFIETAIKKLRELKDLNDGEGITWMITADGWSVKEKSKFYEVANEIGVGIHWTENKEDFINYINNKSDGNRAYDKIHKFVVFSHGYDAAHGGGEHGTMELGAGINISVDDINNRLWATAFDNPNTALYSCSLGTYGDNSFAQHWVNKFGGRTWAFVGKSRYATENINPGFHPVMKASRKLHGFSYLGSVEYAQPGYEPIIDGFDAGKKPYIRLFTRK